MITVKTKTSFGNIVDRLEAEHIDKLYVDKIIKKTVERLKEVTPKKTGLTASSWYYTISDEGNSFVVNINNRNIQNGENIAILINYGHTNGSGYWVNGYHFLEPEIQKVYDQIVYKAWKELKR